MIVVTTNYQEPNNTNAPHVQTSASIALQIKALIDYTGSFNQLLATVAHALTDKDMTTYVLDTKNVALTANIAAQVAAKGNYRINQSPATTRGPSEQDSIVYVAIHDPSESGAPKILERRYPTMTGVSFVSPMEAVEELRHNTQLALLHTVLSTGKLPIRKVTSSLNTLRPPTHHATHQPISNKES